MAIVNYSTGPRIVNEGGHTVYAKATWDAPWTAVPNLKCLECQWNAAPAMNTALLRWDSGAIILPGDSAPTIFGVWVGRGHFIRVDWTCDNGSILRWVGFVDASEWPTEAFGSQVIVCYGLEQALAKTPIHDAVWRDVDRDSMDDPKPGVARRSSFPLTFNADDGRRSNDPIEEEGALYAFAAPREENPQAWSTREIVRYLMAFHLPTNSLGVSTIPWAVDQIDLLPDWDSPLVETRNRTVWDVLNELLSPENLLGFTVGSDGTTLYLRCFTHLADTLTIGSRSLAANPNQHSLVFGPDALTDARLSDVCGGYDQVAVRGARRQSICTLTLDGGGLVKDWSDLEQELYEAGASELDDYDSWSDDEKRARNAGSRAGTRVANVFRDLKLDPEWDTVQSFGYVFPGNVYPRTLRLMERLPIKPGVDWDGEPDEDHFDRNGEGRPAMVFWSDPTDFVTLVDNAALEQFSERLPPLTIDTDFTVRPKISGRTVGLYVQGGPQHLIADEEFSPLPVDGTSTLLDYRTVQVTAAIAEDRFCEGLYPPVAPEADIVRRLVIDLGEDYQQVYIAPATVARLNPQDGEPEISASGYLVNDSPKLAALAQVIAQSVLLTRKTVAWTSLRKISTIAVGDLITAAAGQTVVAPVMAIHIRAGVGINAPAEPARQSFEVYRGTVDPLGVVRRLGGI